MYDIGHDKTLFTINSHIRIIVLRLAFILTALLSLPISAVHAKVPVPNLKPGLKVAKLQPQSQPQARTLAQPQRQIEQRAPRYFQNQTPYPVLKPVDPLQLDNQPVIVIDPGHGGSDPGAIGAKGTLEKTITTQAASELAARLRRSGRYKVILTRTRDNYVNHDDRLLVARTGQADLFISIHADSTRNKAARGASVYTLADRAKGRSKRIVNNQNWILDVDLSEQTDPVGDILVELAQRKTKSQSDAFAEILLNELQGKTKLIGNSHRRAGYYVLLAPDVPAVLLELGFLSNPKDEKLLKTEKHRTKIINSVERAIDLYMSQR